MESYLRAQQTAVIDLPAAGLRDTELVMPERSTAPDPVELTHRGFGLLNSRDLDAARGLVSPDCAWDMSRLAQDVYRGAAAIREFADAWYGTLCGFGIAVEEIEDLGDGVVYARQLAHREGIPGSFIELSTAVALLWEGCVLTQIAVYPHHDEARASAEQLAAERG